MALVSEKMLLISREVRIQSSWYMGYVHYGLDIFHIPVILLRSSFPCDLHLMTTNSFLLNLTRLILLVIIIT